MNVFVQIPMKKIKDITNKNMRQRNHQIKLYKSHFQVIYDHIKRFRRQLVAVTTADVVMKKIIRDTLGQ